MKGEFAKKDARQIFEYLLSIASGLNRWLLPIFLVLITGPSHSASLNVSSAISAVTSGISSTAQTCAIPGAGTTACPVPAAPGSIPINLSIPTGVGNPIDVVTGNKYQYELDYRSFASGLTLARHYNSSLTQYSNGFGPGWRHTYQVVMTQVGENQRNIVQSDGRLISFFKTATHDTIAGREYYEAQSPEDGYLDVGERSIWHIPDGRSMVFHGSYLVLINMGDHRGSLTLHYKNNKLHTVTDKLGDTLTFNYVPGIPALQQYGSDTLTQPAGSITSVTLPNGQSITFEYGHSRNLVSAEYPDSDSVGYGYSNEFWPNHLTLRQSTAEDRITEWRYDDSGHANKWIEGGGKNGLDIERVDPQSLSVDIESFTSPDGKAGTPSSGAIVTYADGRRSQYVWQDNDGGHGSLSQIEIACDNCEPEFIDDDFAVDHADTSAHTHNRLNNRLTDDEENSTDTVTSKDNASYSSVNEDAANTDSFSPDSPLDPLTTSPFTTTIPELWSNLRRSNATTAISVVDVFNSQYPSSQGDIPVQISTSRTGDVIDVKLGERSLRGLAQRSLTESMPPCSTDADSANPATFSHDRIVALGTGSEPCSADGLVLTELTHELESYSKVEQPVSSLRGRAIQWPWSNTQNRYCGLPPGKTCADLQHDLEMAELSQCAYGIVSCEPRFELVPPNDEIFDLDADRFSLDGFEAQLYRDPLENRYILAFRGTDDRSDWGDNILQAISLPSSQYRLAILLARDINSRLHGANLEITGHSLGGGLATAAALAIQKPATVFNAAALQPGSAREYSLDLEYLNADLYVNHIHTTSDPITEIHAVPADGSTQALSVAPGIATAIPNPDLSYMTDSIFHGATLGNRIPPLIWHSMDAVIHVLESLIKFNCP